MKSLFFIFAVLSVSACNAEHAAGDGSEVMSESTEAGAWNHARLTSTDGTNISVDFVVDHVGQINSLVAEPLFINVTNPALSSSSHVRALLNQRAASASYSLGSPVHTTTLPELDLGTITVDLTAQSDGHFSAPVVGNVMLRHSEVTIVSKDECAGGPCGIEQPLYQEVEVAVDDVWLTDPVSGTNKFKINLRAAAGL